MKKSINRSLGTETNAILESISDGVFTVDSNWRIMSFNRAAETITGIRRREAVGKPCSEVFRASMCETDCALRHTVKTGKPIINRSTFIVDAEGRRIPISVSTAILKDKKGRVVGGAETFRDLSLVEELRKELEERFQMGDIVSRCAAMRLIFDILPQIAASDASVLIYGETGTGKELLARAIHNLSPRKTKPFVAVNCGALPDTLLESELFGYVKGAFTGAAKDKPGRFTLAEGGTLFLDEIGDISPALQIRLLRVLQDKRYEPLGGTETLLADVRIVTATHRDLSAQIRKGAFREDLFYRLNVVKVDLPPLRKRKEDIPLLVDHFIARFNRLQGKAVMGASPDVMALLMAHDYPGNVRELENIIERAFVLCGAGSIEHAQLPPELGGRASSSPSEGNTITAQTHATETQAIRTALERHGFNRLAAARALGLHKSTLFRKIKALGLNLPEHDGRSRRKST
ncbi:MAG: sigma 54-interacting transcriptional regulator [Kiritimatiellae bacterium]|nr:sigma 54-interacting transcriptional regulator [Verrucomicrobiota bacterium]MCG2659554.1 sigma 54-interacting transcriptional regulator [Kiritimatiellia bacterium]